MTENTQTPENGALFDAHYEAHRWVEHYDSPGGDPSAGKKGGAVGPRYGTLEEQAQMARAVTLYDAAIDAVAGDLYLMDIGEQTRAQMIKGIRETLERLDHQKREARLR